MDELKKCTKCGEWKPHDQFSKQSSKKDGLQSHCRACQAAYYAANRERYAETGRAWREANKDRKAETHREWAKANKEAISANGKKWYEANKERHAANGRAQYERNKERYAAKSKAWREANKDREAETHRIWYRANKERHAAKAREWNRANPDKRRVHQARHLARYRTRKGSLPDTLTPTEWRAALNYFGGCCAVCGRPPGLWHTLAADHWIPISSPDCPGTVAWNIVPLCQGAGGCNNSKGRYNPTNWLIGKFGNRKGNAIRKRVEDWLDSRRPDE